ALLALSPSSAQAGRFYLSSERVFPPGQPAEVQVEANDVEALQVRLYRIRDPRAYFDAQADLHRPAAESGTPRESAWSLLAQGARTGLRDLNAELRRKLGREAKDSIKEAFPELHQAASTGSEEAVDKVLPPIAAHELLEIWSMPLLTRN